MWKKIINWRDKNINNKIIYWFIFILVIPFILLCVINCASTIIIMFLKYHTLDFKNFHLAYADKYSWIISVVLFIIAFLFFLWFYVSHKIDNMDSSKTKQQKRNKASDKEFKTLQLKMLALNNKYGIPKTNLTQHTLLVGTTGSGKTTTLMQIIKELRFKFRETTIIIDGKGDIDLIGKVKQLDLNAFIWEIGGATEYNPFATKDSVVLSDKIMSLFDFSEPFYRDKAKHYLLILLNVLIEKKIDISLNNIIEYFNIEKLLKLVDVKSVNYDMLSNNFAEKEISGIISKLNITNMQLNNSIGDNNNLLELITKHKTILFSINSLKYPELAGAVGKIIIQDLKELTTLKPVNQKINIVLDEFNVFASETIVNLINKSRSFNYQCFLSFQTINDLKTKNMNLIDTIFGNVSTIVCHNIKDPNTAEYVASVFGTQETEKLTRQLDFKNNTADMGSVRSVDEFIVHPNDLKTLKIGECYLKTTLPSGKLFIKKIQVEPTSLDGLIQHVNK
ncbi:type IV secretory system conjugative DNA transfer family protein [Spiroplasma endosymbiont of Glossina fuscipes fuscipes]|uniref:type IV secretory system conjugative DNA transfer family protein n=1 Tax=Spiroplasma endosymbiont of Glossina fuscipes fuscipes TaxID=2004463 RepID=UPI003CF2692F